MESKKKRKGGIAGKILLALVWIGIIVLCFLHRDDLSVEGIVRYTPENPWLAALVMLALFALKSLSIVIYSGLLYAASGILFPIPAAILVNLCGGILMATIPYCIGRKGGASAVEAVRRKYPKTQSIQEVRAGNDFIFTFLVRMARLPGDVVSLYMGAIGVDYRKYLPGSLLGMLPHMITYPIMGMRIGDIRSPEFIISLCVCVAYTVVTSVIYAVYRKRHKPDRQPAQADTDR